MKETKKVKASQNYIRLDGFNLQIKIRTAGPQAHGWSVLEKGFSDHEALLARFNELIATGKYIGG